MKKSILLLFLVVLNILLGCNQKKTEKQKYTKSIQNAVVPIKSDTITIDLIALQKKGRFSKTQKITVKNDPVYHSVKHYNAFSLKNLLNSLEEFKNKTITNYQIIFECNDGYKPFMDLQKFLSKNSYIAVSDIDAPKGYSWSKIIKNGQEMNAAPFYLIYSDVDPNDTNYKWPYNLVKIHIIPNNDKNTILYPKDNKKAQSGFNLFNKNCIICHSINKIGGKMGPELNYPKSVTEYWNIRELNGFIKNPADYRNNVKMPKLNLSDNEIENIVYYLTYMTKHKL